MWADVIFNAHLFVITLMDKEGHYMTIFIIFRRLRPAGDHHEHHDIVLDLFLDHEH